MFKLAIQRPSNDKIRRQWFSTKLVGPPKHGSPVSFTITFRPGEDEAWKWANEQFSTSDGKLIYKASSLQQDLPDYIGDLPAYLQIQKESSDTPSTLLWSITSPVAAASGTASGFTTNKLGTPLSFSRWFALVRLWSPWIAPRQGKAEFRLDKEAVLAAFERNDGSHLVVLPVSGLDDVLTTLRHDDQGNVVIESRNDRESEGHARLVASVGQSFETAVATAMYYARKIVGKYEIETGQASEEMQALLDGFRPEWLENWYDGLSYCTWNGLGQNLTEQKIFDALDSLAKNGINGRVSHQYAINEC